MFFMFIEFRLFFWGSNVRSRELIYGSAVKDLVLAGLRLTLRSLVKIHDQKDLLNSDVLSEDSLPYFFAF